MTTCSCLPSRGDRNNFLTGSERQQGPGFEAHTSLRCATQVGSDTRPSLTGRSSVRPTVVFIFPYGFLSSTKRHGNLSYHCPLCFHPFHSALWKPRETFVFCVVPLTIFQFPFYTCPSSSESEDICRHGNTFLSPEPILIDNHPCRFFIRSFFNFSQIPNFCFDI